jgi:hypothetical protein
MATAMFAKILEYSQDSMQLAMKAKAIHGKEYVFNGQNVSVKFV